MRLYGVQKTHRGPFCAPYALAVLTGQPMERFMPRRADGEVKRRGMSVQQMVNAAKECGIRLKIRHLTSYRYDPDTGRVAKRHRPLLWQALKPHEHGLITTSSHVLAFDGYIVHDSHSERKQWVHDSPFARRHADILMVVQP